MVTSLDSLSQGLPEVVASETDSGKSSSRWVRMKKKITVESRHPCPSGMSKHLVKIPGAVSLALTFHANSQQTVNQGGQIQVKSSRMQHL